MSVLELPQTPSCAQCGRNVHTTATLTSRYNWTKWYASWNQQCASLRCLYNQQHVSSSTLQLKWFSPL